MDIRIITWQGADIAEVTGEEKSIRDTKAIKDLFARAQEAGKADRLLINRNLIDESFFDLKTGFADELIGAFHRHPMKLAVTGYIPPLQTLALKAFLFEKKLGKSVRLIADREKALDWLSRA